MQQFLVKTACHKRANYGIKLPIKDFKLKINR